MKIALLGGKRRFPPRYFPPDVEAPSPGLKKKISNALAHGELSIFSSEAVSQFEAALAAYLSVRHCCVVSNGTMALVAALQAVGVGNGDQIILPGYSYYASLAAVRACGCTPFFADIDPNTYGIDVDSVPRSALRTARAIMPVHLFGNPCNMDAILSATKSYGLRLIEDCAQGTGAKWAGSALGSYDVGCHSFMQNKLVRMGEGGAVCSNDRRLVNAVRCMRHEGEIWSRHGISTAERCEISPLDIIQGIEYVGKGLNLRPPAISALIGSCSLLSVDERVAARCRNADILTNAFTDVPELQVQSSYREGGRVWLSFVATVSSQRFNRNTLLAACLAEGIPAGVHFPYPLYRAARTSACSAIRLQNVEAFCQNHIAFPVYGSLSAQHMAEIGNAVTDIVVALRGTRKPVLEAGEKLLREAKISAFYSGSYFCI